MNLTQTEIDSLVDILKKFPYFCAAGEDEFGPLSGPPQIEPDVELKPITLYETESEEQASILAKNNVKVTIKTRNIDKAMELLGSFVKGENIYAAARKKALTMVPITASTTEKTISFPNAFLQPGLSFTPGQNSDPSEATLVFICRAAADTGKPFVYGSGV